MAVPHPILTSVRLKIAEQETVAALSWTIRGSRSPLGGMRARTLAISDLVPRHLGEVRERRLGDLDKVEDAVKDRMRREITHLSAPRTRDRGGGACR